MRTSVTTRLLICAAFTTALGSCATLQRALQKPAIRFDRANLAAISLGGVTLDLVFDVHNPNAIGLSLAELDAKLFVENKQLAATKPPGGLTLPARGSTKITLPMQINFADVAGVAHAFLSKDTASYRFEGNLGLKSPIGVVRVPVGAEGRFDVPKIPAIALSQPRIKSLSTTSATIELPIEISNPNALPLPIDMLKGSLRVDGANVASLALDRIGALEPKSSKQIVAPLELHFGASLAALQALRRGRARMELAGELDSGPAALPIHVAEQVALSR